MNLDDQQKLRVTAWIQEGLSLSDIQNKLASEFGIRLTYMEVRFLLDDLRLKPKDKEAARAAPSNLPELGVQPGRESTPSKHDRPGKQSPAAAAKKASTTPGSVTVTVDQVTRPGALVSGAVTFSDGNAAEWYLDQFGRLGVVPKVAGYKPSQSDLMTFQAQLQNELAKLGL